MLARLRPLGDRSSGTDAAVRSVLCGADVDCFIVWLLLRSMSERCGRVKASRQPERPQAQWIKQHIRGPVGKECEPARVLSHQVSGPGTSDGERAQYGARHDLWTAAIPLAGKSFASHCGYGMTYQPPGVP